MRWIRVDTAPAGTPVTSAIAIDSSPSRYKSMTCLSIGRSRWINQPVQCHAVVRDAFRTCLRCGFFQADASIAPPSFGRCDMRSATIVGHSINPSAQRAALVKRLQATPQGHVDFLEQVLSYVRIGFVGRREPLKSRSEIGDAAFVEVVFFLNLAYLYDCFNSSHSKVVGEPPNPLQGIRPYAV
jgi:hypothetical protein